MYKLSRLMLIGTVLAAFACVAVLAEKLGGAILFWIGIALLVGFARRGRRVFTAFGTARWADVDDLRATRMLGARTGLPIGRVTGAGKRPLLKAVGGLFDPSLPSKEVSEEFLEAIQRGRKPTINPALVRLVHAVHSAIFGPTGAGKGVSFIVPFVWTCPDPMVIVDFKGEIARLTARHRREVFGHRTVIIDPYKQVTQTPDTFNTLSSIDKDSPLAIDDSRDQAEAAVIRTGQEKDPHWVDSAEAWIAALIALVVKYGEPVDRSLQTVRTLLTSPDKLEMAIKLMCASDAWDGMLARMGNQLTHFKDKELGSTLTTTNRFLRFLDTLAVAESTKTSSFDPADLLKGKMTVYLVLPPEHMRAQSPLLRMWIGSLLRAVVRGGLQDHTKVHFVLDEAASLGHMEALDDAVDKYRGYGVRLQFYYQSLGQLRKCFPDGQEQTLLSNVSQVFFAVNDLPTAEYVSNRLGEATIAITSGGTSTGTSRSSSANGQNSHGYSTNHSENWQQHGRKLLKPEEVMMLPERTAITFTPGVPPVCTTLVRYYEESRFGQGPGPLERYKAAGKVLFGSLALLLGAVLLAMALSTNGQGQVATQPPPAVWDFQSQK